MARLSLSKVSPQRYALVLAVAAAVYVVDQVSKAMVVERIGPEAGYPQVQVIGDIVRLTFVTNSGAAFGMFPQATTFFTVASLLAIPVLFWLQGNMLKDDWLTRLSLGLLLGGNLGNLTDRIRLGYVIDFLDSGINDARWYTFNVADASCVIGIAIIAFCFLFYPEPEPARQDA